MLDMDYVSFGNGNKNLCILPGVTLKRILPAANSVKTQYKKLLNDFTVYVFERKNNMQSDYSVEEMACDTVKKMRELGIEKTSLFGVSQGGMISQIIAAEHPELTEKLVVCSSLAKTNDTINSCVNKWIALAEEKNYRSLARDMIEKLYSEQFVKKCGKVLVDFFSGTSDEDAERFVTQCKACKNYNSYGLLEQIKCPSFVLGAKFDKVLGSSGSVELAETLGCEMYLYDMPYGHACYDEAPDFCDRLLDFLK